MFNVCEDAITNKILVYIKKKIINVRMLHKAFLSFFLSFPAPLVPLGVILVRHFLKECGNAAVWLGHCQSTAFDNNVIVNQPFLFSRLIAEYPY